MQNIYVVDFDSALLRYLKADLGKFDSQRVFIDFSKKPGAENVADLVDAADDLFGDPVQI